MSPRGLLVLPVGDATVASVRYRVLAHLPALEAAGFAPRVRLAPPSRSGPAGRISRLLDLVRDIREPGPERTVFVHRKTYPPWFAARLRRPGRVLVYDMDDALDLPPPGREPAPALAERHRVNFQATMSAADLVVCGNAELAAKVAHGRTRILPTPIDTDRFRPGAAAPPAGPALGWVGHSDNFAYLEGLGEALREVSRRHPRTKLVVVADRAPSIPGIDLEFRRWTLDTEISCFDGIGVGLMPLHDTPWARAKCAFKAIQYMALGIPAVASPVGMNREVIRDGVSGFLPGDERAWVAALDTLLSDPERARAVGAAGRRAVEERYALASASRALIGWLSEAAEAR